MCLNQQKISTKKIQSAIVVKTGHERTLVFKVPDAIDNFFAHMLFLNISCIGDFYIILISGKPQC